jgi:mannosyltransferase OCH1-like enzyme
MQTWREHLPEYRFVCWSKEKAGSLMQIPWVREAYECKKYAFAADYIRLYALYHEGGLYLDADVQVVRDLSPLLVHSSFIGRETGGDFEPAIIGAAAGMEWIARCLAYYKDRHFFLPDGAQDTCPLPTIMENILRANYRIHADALEMSACKNIGLAVYPADFFSPKSAHSGKIKITSNTYTIHHFDGSWISKDFPYRLKQAIHKVLIALMGQKLHNIIVRNFRKLK